MNRLSTIIDCPSKQRRSMTDEGEIMEDRRKVGRTKLNLEARWEGVLGRFEGIIVDSSRNGCFLLTSDKVQPSELIRLEIRLPDDGQIYLWAEVVYQISEMGFALRFTGSGAEEEAALEELLSHGLGQ